MPFPLGEWIGPWTLQHFILGNSLCERFQKVQPKIRKKLRNSLQIEEKIICGRAPFYLAVAMALSSVTPTALQVLDTGLPDSHSCLFWGASWRICSTPHPPQEPQSQDTPSLPRPRAANPSWEPSPSGHYCWYSRENIPPSPPHFPLRFKFSISLRLEIALKKMALKTVKFLLHYVLIIGHWVS